MTKAAALKPHSSGHIFGSMDAVSDSSGGTVAEQRLRWQKRYTRMPGEEINVCSPFRLPSQSPWLKDAIIALKEGFLKDKSLPCQYFTNEAATYMQQNHTLTNLLLDLMASFFFLKLLHLRLSFYGNTGYGKQF